MFSVVVFLCLESWAEKPLKKVRPEAEAEAHFLKKDRAQASTVLLESIKKLGPTSEKRKQLSRQLDQFLEMFYTEAAQKIYEQGNSLYAKEPALALEKFEEAKRLEPDNVLVLENIARLNIHSKSCGKASEELKPVLKLNPYRQNALVLMLKAFECSGDLAEAEKFYTTGAPWRLEIHKF